MNQHRMIILGATGGIGRQLAMQAVQYYSDIYLVGRNRTLLLALQQELYAVNPKSRVCIQVLDAMDPLLDLTLSEWFKWMDAVTIVNCMGYAVFHDTPGDEAQMWQINYHFPKQLIDFCMATKQKITFVHLSSLAALMPHPYLKTYAATKSAMHQYLLSMDYELKHNESFLRLKTIVLGPVNTAFLPELVKRKIGFTYGEMSSRKVAKKILSIGQSRQSYVIVGWRNRLGVLVARFLPVKVQQKIIGKLLERGVR